MVSLWTMLFREIAYRRLSALISLLGVAGAAGLLVGVLVSLEIHAARSEAIVRRKEAETRRAMESLRSDVSSAMGRLGYNAILLPKDQPLGDWYAEDYASKTMPEAESERLAKTKGLADRYLPRLRKRIKWEEKKWTVIVVGVGKEHILDASVGSVGPLVESIPKGACVVGYELHHALGLRPGDVISVNGSSFKVAKCAKELGTKDDITLWMNLSDAQQFLDSRGLINEILLVEHASIWGRLAELRRRIAQILPDCQVVEMASETMSRAHARVKVAEEAKAAMEQERGRRAMLEAERARVLGIFAPLGALIGAMWVGIAMYLNVRERNQEIGVLMAQGFRVRSVQWLLLSKAVFLGLAGGVVGFAAGAAGAILWEKSGAAASLGAAAGAEYVGLAILMSVGACLLGSWLPVWIAVKTDPAAVLRQE